MWLQIHFIFIPFVTLFMGFALRDVFFINFIANFKKYFMKKFVLILCAFFMGILAQAQITLEHSYYNNSTINPIKIEVDGDKYMGIDTLTFNINLYNADHTLWKVIPTHVPDSMYKYVYAYYPSKYLFNTDDNIEVIIFIQISHVGGSSYIPPTYDIRVINELGTVLADYPGRIFQGLFPINGAWKMHLHNSDATYHEEIYGLTGTYSGLRVKNPNSTATETELYPNPVENSAVLMYNLPMGTHKAQLNIYNSMGKIVRQSELTDQFDNVLIPKNELPTGVYIYKITSNDGVLDTKQFEVR